MIEFILRAALRGVKPRAAIAAGSNLAATDVTGLHGIELPERAAVGVDPPLGLQEKNSQVTNPKSGRRTAPLYAM